MHLIFLGGPIIRPHKQPLCEATFSHSNKVPVIAVKRRGLARGLEVLVHSQGPSGLCGKRTQGKSGKKDSHFMSQEAKRERGRDWEPTIPFQAVSSQDKNLLLGPTP